MGADTAVRGQLQHPGHIPLYRLTAIAGIGSVVLALIVFALFGSAPSTDASGEQIIAYASHNQRQLFTLVYLFGLSLGCMLCFLTGVYMILRRVGQNAEILATLGLVGAIVWVPLGFEILLFVVGLAFRTIHDPVVARTLADLAALSANISGFPTAVNMLAFAAAILLSGILPRWMGWLAVVVALVHLVSAAAYMQSGLMSPSLMPGLVAPVLYYLWVLVVSVGLLRTR